MEISKTFYAKNGKQWRAWLTKNHTKSRDIWLVFYRKATKKPNITYNDAVNEALCFGWIDSQVKNIDKKKYAQRFTPRREGSNISFLNLERIRRLTGEGKMTSAGLIHLDHTPEIEFVIPPDITRALKKNKSAWKNFQKLPEHYKKIRIGWIVSTRISDRKRRLEYFIKMTAKNKKFGTIQ